MPELPDIVVYQEALQRYVVGHVLRDVRLGSPFLVRSVEPPLSAMCDQVITGIERIGKRLVFRSGDDLHAVLHLMIAGRLRWRPVGGKAPGRSPLAMFVFDHGWLILTEAGTKRRASLTVVRGRAALAAIDRGGLEVLSASSTAFAERLLSENHTLKRALTDPRLFSGIGNAYSDEILHRARLSPLLTTARMQAPQVERLYAAVQDVLQEWIERLRVEVGSGFPETVTAFRPEMAVHGRYGLPCPDCSAPVQRIRYADNETNYCARCQTEGRLLADRSLSRLLKQDWPRSLDELELDSAAR